MKKVIAYARLSRDEDKKNYGSIETQINMINDFAKQNNLVVEKKYIDDDVSGYLPIQKRPAFNELYNFVKEEKIKPIVLTKDWSRLSRNNAIAQTLLNEWKNEEVELILIKEMGAPFNILKDNDDIVGITTWINERYVKETSRKVRDALSDRMKAGVVVMGPRYGYIKGPNGTLTVNEEVREAVQTIYKLYLQGYGFDAITRKLNLEFDFKNPSVVEAERFKKEKGRDIKRSVREYWEHDMISKILRDKTYVGTLVTHKKEVIGIHGKAKILSADENYEFPNHHEAIIDEDTFYKVQDLLKQRKEHTALYKKGKNNYIFGGFIRCGDCGASGTGYIKYGKKGYECLNYSKYRTVRCTYHSVREDYILENFKALLKNLRKEYKDLLQGINVEIRKKKSKDNREIVKKKIEKAKNEFRIMQGQKIKEMVQAKNDDAKDIIEETYSNMIDRKLKEITELNETLKYLNTKTEESKTEKIKKAIEYFDEIIKSNNPSKEVLSQVLDSIVLYKGKNIEFKLKMNIDKLI